MNIVICPFELLDPQDLWDHEEAGPMPVKIFRKPAPTPQLQAFIMPDHAVHSIGVFIWRDAFNYIYL